MSPSAEPLQRQSTLPFAAASGLVAAHAALWVIADDGLQLQQLDAQGTSLASHPLFPGREALPQQPKARKKAKPDLEALCLLPDGRLLALGSGSRPQRRLGSLFEPATGRVQSVDAAALYQQLEQTLPELNIEGACFWSETLLLAHRGNSAGAGAGDALIPLHGATAMDELARGVLTPQSLRGHSPLQLGLLDEEQLTITDLATDDEGQLWFSAAAEATRDRYEDGACAGSVLGRLDATLTPVQQWRLSGRQKIEGLALRAATPGHLQWWLVADADDPAVHSPLWSVQLPRSRVA